MSPLSRRRAAAQDTPPIRAKSALSSAPLAPIYASIARYYDAKVAAFGATPAGADWSSGAAQELRFAQLLAICDFSAPFSLNDVGCGYGALLRYLARAHRQAEVDYFGIDLSANMIAQARRIFGHVPGRRFALAAAMPRIADYSVASGVFNVKLRHARPRWEQFVARTLCDMHAASRRGFAVNFRARPDDRQSAGALYHASIDAWAAFCSVRFKARVEVRTQYGLSEFTLLVRSRRDDER